MEEKYVEPETQTAAKPTTPTKPQTQTNPNSIRDALLSRPGATISDGHVDGYTSQEDREKLDDGEFKDLIWN